MPEHQHDYRSELADYIDECAPKNHSSVPDPRMCRLMLPRATDSFAEVTNLIALRREIDSFTWLCNVSVRELPGALWAIGPELQAHAKTMQAKLTEALADAIEQVHDSYGQVDGCRYPGGLS